MKKKTYYLTDILVQSVYFIVILGSGLAVFACGVYYFIDSIHNGFGESVKEIGCNIFFLVACCVFSFGLIREFIRLERMNITFTDEKIYMNDDLKKPYKDKLQYYSEAKFVDVESVDIIWTVNNSIGEPIKSRTVFAFVSKPYLSIKTSNGKRVNFFIQYFSRKSIVKIVNELGFRMKEVGNNAEIMKEDEVLSKLKGVQNSDKRKKNRES